MSASIIAALAALTLLIQGLFIMPYDRGAGFPRDTRESIETAAEPTEKPTEKPAEAPSDGGRMHDKSPETNTTQELPIF